jgi:hypothetical protein
MEGLDYPHTPKDKTQWKPQPAGEEWKGECGRDEEELEMFLQMERVKQAGLEESEVIGIRLYSGPMFALYNAVLRGFPSWDVACLEGNRYETTIFMIVSAITKLSKISAVPKGRLLYRGLNGLVLPEQFWESFDECQVSLLIRSPVPEDLVAMIKTLVKKGGTQEKLHDLTEYLALPQPLQMQGHPAPLQVRVAREAAAGQHGVTITVALRVAKKELGKDQLHTLCEGVAVICGVQATDVMIAHVAHKPRDYKGGGES